MHPVILELPFGFSVKAYGLMMMLGFIAATWWAMHRARLVKADPDVILNLGFISLISGIVGARLLYVIEFWHEDFARQPNRLLAAINLTSGGLVFYGGLLLAVACVLIYLWAGKHSIRLYLDILAPSIMLGLAFGRMGCFLNGCCWGAPTEQVPWTVRFPYASPAFTAHWHDGLVAVPQQLLITGANLPASLLVDREHLHVSTEQLRAPQRRVEAAQEALAKARQAGDTAAVARAQKELDAARKALQKVADKYLDLLYMYETYGQTPEDVAALASHYRSAPVHPVQIYSLIDAVLIGLLLHAIFLRRRQQGVVFGLLFIFYPIGRYLEEAIRGDNALDYGLGPLGMTISQAISFWSLLFAVVYLIVLYRLPAAPPSAVRVLPPEPESPAASGAPATRK